MVAESQAHLHHPMCKWVARATPATLASNEERVLPEEQHLGLGEASLEGVLEVVVDLQTMVIYIGTSKREALNMLD